MSNNAIFLVEEQTISEDGSRRAHSLNAYSTEEEAFNIIHNYIRNSDDDVKWKFDFKRESKDWLPPNAIKIIGTGTFLISHTKKKGEKGTMILTVYPVWMRRPEND